MGTQLTVKDIVTRRREATRVSHPLMFSASALIDVPPHKNHASPTQGELTCVVLYYIDLRRVVVMYYSCMYILYIHKGNVQFTSFWGSGFPIVDHTVLMEVQQYYM